MVRRKDPHNNFGRSVSHKLTERNLTHNDLGNMLGTKRAYVTQTMTGYRKPLPYWVDLVAEALDFTPQERASLHRDAALDCGFKLDLTK